MVKQLVPAFVFIIFLSSCSSFKPLNFTSNRQVSSINEPAPSLTAQAKFIEQISVTTSVPVTDKAEMPDIWEVKPSRTAKVQETAASPAKVEDPKTEAVNLFANRTPAVENASSVQLKYSLLLDTEVESLPSKSLLESVDEWYGVRYRVGGNSKKGVDCSGFTVAVYAAVYGMMLPRISRDQYRISRKISTTELREGDLVFFNTNGRGVSHVGVYLGNNKFIHASVSRGVMVNDLFENYYLRRFVGAGRIDEKQAVVSNE